MKSRSNDCIKYIKNITNARKRLSLIYYNDIII